MTSLQSTTSPLQCQRRRRIPGPRRLNSFAKRNYNDEIQHPRQETLVRPLRYCNLPAGLGGADLAREKAMMPDYVPEDDNDEVVPPWFNDTGEFGDNQGDEEDED